MDPSLVDHRREFVSITAARCPSPVKPHGLGYDGKSDQLNVGLSHRRRKGFIPPLVKSGSAVALISLMLTLFVVFR